MREPILQALQNALETDAAFHDDVARDPAAALLARGYRTLTEDEVRAVGEMAARTPRPRRFALRRHTLVVLGTLVLLVAGGFAWGVGGFRADVGRRTAQADVSAVDYRVVRWYEEVNGRETERSGYDVSFSFSAGGQVHRGDRSRDERFHPAERYIICYNPDDPADFGFYRAAQVRCGKP